MNINEQTIRAILDNLNEGYSFKTEQKPYDSIEISESALDAFIEILTHKSDDEDDDNPWKMYG